MEQRITHACGHAQDHYIPGFAAQRERKAGWLRTTDCRACFIAARRLAEATTAARDGDAVAFLPLAALIGSERQVSWATTIRARRLAALVAAHGALAMADHPCLAIVDARWWIDARDLADADLLAKAAAEPVAAAA